MLTTRNSGTLLITLQSMKSGPLKACLLPLSVSSGRKKKEREEPLACFETKMVELEAHEGKELALAKLATKGESKLRIAHSTSGGESLHPDSLGHLQLSSIDSAVGIQGAGPKSAHTLSPLTRRDSVPKFVQVHLPICRNIAG